MENDSSQNTSPLLSPSPITTYEYDDLPLEHQFEILKHLVRNLTAENSGLKEVAEINKEKLFLQAETIENQAELIANSTSENSKLTEDMTILQTENNQLQTSLAEKQEVINKLSEIVHKNVLSIISPVFARMFESDMIEAKEGKAVIKDFTFEIVEKSIKSCYHKSLVPETSLEDATKMLQFYDKYDIQPLKNQLEVQLITAIDSSNVCLLANCSLFTNARKLEKRCAKFLHGCLKTKPIADFDLLDKEFALNLMKNAFFHVSSN